MEENECLYLLVIEDHPVKYISNIVSEKVVDMLNELQPKSFSLFKINNGFVRYLLEYEYPFVIKTEIIKTYKKINT